MKKIIFTLAVLGLAGICHAATPVAEAPVKDYGTPVTISISTSTLTMVPSSQTSGRIGIFLDNPGTNNARVVGFYGNCTSTALASTIRPIEIAQATNSTYIPLREDVCLWFLSLHTSAESIHYQEVKQ